MLQMSGGREFEREGPEQMKALDPLLLNDRSDVINGGGAPVMIRLAGLWTI